MGLPAIAATELHDELARAARGDRAAQAAVYHATRRLAFDVALRLLRSVPDAEAVVQEAFIRVFRAMSERPITHFKAYLIRTTSNLATDRLRKRQRETLVDTPPEQGAVVHIFSDGPRLRAAVATLPPEQRTVLELRYQQELSFGQIAAELGMSKNGVHARHQRALSALRGLLGPED